MQIISSWLLGIGYGVCAIEDCRRKTVPMWALISMAIAGIIIRIKTGELLKIELIYSFSIGIAMIIASAVTNEMIGFGDSFLILISGLYLSVTEIIAEFFIASSLCGISGLVLFLLLKKSGKYEIPFVPFLLAAYVLMRLLEGEQ